ncbi:MAG: hypothetical protein HeimC2_45460 [Candidatus Heimdallarchaeota archaeon LC_2]|nr:MAG: hypothetical protein HeimC2_45460 [Candidatus Heimdallarchaeota archaeon LC_2]
MKEIIRRKVFPEKRMLNGEEINLSKSLIAVDPGIYYELTNEKNFSIFANGELLDFIKEPYLVMPYKVNEYLLIVPAFLDISFGILYFENKSYKVYLVNKYTAWVNEIPKKMQEKFPNIETNYIQINENNEISNFSIIENELPKIKSWIHFQSDGKIFVKDKFEYDFKLKLIDEGYLPYKSIPVSKIDLHNTLTIKSINLRDYQIHAWERFNEHGSIGVYWPPSAGKTIFGLFLVSKISGNILIVVPTITLKEQWKNKLLEYFGDKILSRVEIITYHGHVKVAKNIYSLTIYDEHQHLPAKTFYKLALLKTKYRVGLSATPFREDGKTKLIFALTGLPVGVNWDVLREKRIIENPNIEVIVVKNLSKKFEKLEKIINFDKKTLIFSDSIEFGEKIGNKLNVPFISGKSKNRIQQISNNKVIVVSRVADEGISIDDLEVIIEFDFLFGSRRQELQRLGRLLHSKSRGNHYVLVTTIEFQKYGKRFDSLKEKGFQIKLTKEE